MSVEDKKRWKELLREVADFPKPGILFQDIGPLIADPPAWKSVIDALSVHYKDDNITLMAGAEARGYLFSGPLAYTLNAGVLLVRKPNKLPGEKVFVDYGLEYGKNRIEISVGAVKPGDRVLVIDDLLATGGTAEACCKLVEQCGGVVVGCAFVVELAGLGGAERLAKYNPFSLITIDEP